MRIIVLLVLSFLTLTAHAGENAAALLKSLNGQFNRINDYTAQVDMNFDIPGVKMSKMRGKVFFKKPNKFRIRTKGIFFLPKQNPMQDVNALLLDTVSYTNIISGYEVVNGRNCAIVNIIPLQSGNELILGKFWIDTKNPIVLKSQITTRNNGTIEAENYYNNGNTHGLPDKMIIRVEMKRIKMSKMMSADLNKKSKDKNAVDQLEKGSITLIFTDYKINTRLPDTAFDETPN